MQVETIMYMEMRKKIVTDSLLCAISSKAAVLFCHKYNGITNLWIADVAGIMMDQVKS